MFVPEKEMVGVDVFLHWNPKFGNAEQLAAAVRKCEGDGMELVLITNRGKLQNKKKERKRNDQQKFFVFHQFFSSDPCSFSFLQAWRFGLADSPKPSAPITGVSASRQRRILPSQRKELISFFFFFFFCSWGLHIQTRFVITRSSRCWCGWVTLASTSSRWRISIRSMALLATRSAKANKNEWWQAACLLRREEAFFAYATKFCMCET